MAFEYGADDYVVKPFDPLEFRSRIFSRIKKTKEKSEDQSKILIGDFSLDLQTFKAFMKQGSQTIDLNLTPLEIKILFYLAHSMDQVFSRAQIMDYLWKDTYVNDRTVDSHIAHLRQKILDTPISIDTVKGIGYKISRK
jgi:DNA-binding response OmpR family regulator